MEERNEKGQFIKGSTFGTEYRFKKGEHWRDEKPFWNKEWLFNEYVINQKSCSEIASWFSISPQAIVFWLRKHDIQRRSISETRKVKHWGCFGADNPMYQKTWKPPKPFWNKKWLLKEYITKRKSAVQIAKEQCVSQYIIYYWTKKHKIYRFK